MERLVILSLVWQVVKIFLNYDWISKKVINHTESYSDISKKEASCIVHAAPHGCPGGHRKAGVGKSVLQPPSLGKRRAPLATHHDVVDHADID